MGIQKDAEELLVFIYKRKLAGEEMPIEKELLDITGWDKHRIFIAIEYLVNIGFVKGQSLKGTGTTVTQFAYVSDILPAGIDLLEDDEKFEKHFQHTIDLGIYKFSWGRTKKF